LTYIFGATASAAAYRRDLFEDIGLFDETFFAYMEDVDFALRAQMAGWKCTYYPPARAYHMVSATGGGKFASYHVARNTIYLIAKNFPLALFQKAFGRIVGAQSQRFFDALKHWRGEAARATMYGVLMGILTAPRMVGKRRHIMQKRTLSDEDMFALLAQYCD